MWVGRSTLTATRVQSPCQSRYVCRPALVRRFTGTCRRITAGNDHVSPGACRRRCPSNEPETTDRDGKFLSAASVRRLPIRLLSESLQDHKSIHRQRRLTIGLTCQYVWQGLPSKPLPSRTGYARPRRLENRCANGWSGSVSARARGICCVEGSRAAAAHVRAHRS